MVHYRRIIPRLDGEEIEDRFDYYLRLVKNGVAGFIIFGGELETVRHVLKRLQYAAGHPLIIASDLEQGLGQQIRGGTIFPPAMAIASAINSLGPDVRSSELRNVYRAIAVEARYAGINAILAPVVDINTNPENPIIATRAFGEDPETVSFFGCEMIRVLQENRIIACGKHFPGHGDTEVDSHIGLPLIRKDLSSLENLELVPFKRAIDAGVGMIMLGHLSVPAIDPSGIPVSLSDKAVSYLRKRLGFKGMVLTDAMNMGAIGEYAENEASLMALRAGADIILHPADPDGVAAYLGQKGYKSGTLNLDHTSLTSLPSQEMPAFSEHKRLSEELTKMAIRADGEIEIKRPFLILLNDEKKERGLCLIRVLQERYPHIKHCTVLPGEDVPWHTIPAGHELIAGVFSEIKAWKGRTSLWLKRAIDGLKERARLFISFGNPYVIGSIQGVPKIYAYWDSEAAEKAVAEGLLLRRP
ncbi:MAG: glycoside hydrolase family 3 N-terminal domain-containing protein [Thermodesulfovibrionales bacterium]